MSKTLDAFGYQISGDLASALIAVPLVALFLVALKWAFKNECGRYGGDDSGCSDHVGHSRPDGSCGGQIAHDR